MDCKRTSSSAQHVRGQAGQLQQQSTCRRLTGVLCMLVYGLRVCCLSGWQDAIQNYWQCAYHLLCHKEWITTLWAAKRLKAWHVAPQ
jgi:hypothetical protein